MIDQYRKKTSEQVGNILKAVLVNFIFFFKKKKKKKKKLEFQTIFDNSLAKYLFSKEFTEGIDYISSYLPKSE